MCNYKNMKDQNGKNKKIRPFSLIKCFIAKRYALNLLAKLLGRI